MLLLNIMDERAFAEFLIRENLVDTAILEQADETQKVFPARIDTILVAMGAVPEHKMEKALGKFQQKAQTNRASTALEIIVPAAHFGRVEVLLIAAGAQQMGSFDRVTGDIDLDNGNNHEVIDLVDHAVRRTLLARGSVYAIPHDKMPKGALMAAMLRY